MKTVIPMILQPATENYFWVQNIIEGILNTSARYDSELLIIEKEVVLERNLSRNLPVLVNGHLSEWLSDTAQFLQWNGYTPIIINAGYVNTRECKYSSVQFDMASGVREVVDYCNLCGHRNMVLFGVRSGVAGDQEKVRLFRQCADQMGLADLSVVYMGNTLEESIHEFVNYFWDIDKDVVFCANDTVAIFLIQELKKNGIRIPEDVLIFGVGDSLVGRLAEVSLISLTADYVELGKQAVRLWRYLFKDGTDVHITMSVACHMNQKNINVEKVFSKRHSKEVTVEVGKNIGCWNDYFYEDEMVKRLHRLESLLQSCDETDMVLLKAIKNEKQDEVIAEEIWMTPRAIRYRINKMMKKIGVQNRSEIVELLREFRIWGEE